METKEFKKITKYDDYTINEFVKALVEARKNFNDTIVDKDDKISEVDSKIQELNNINTKHMSPEEKETHKAKKENFRKEKSGYSKEKTQAKNYFAKWEKEKERIKNRLNSKIEENENKIEENKLKIEENENTIKENEEKMEGMDQKSPEFEKLVMDNRALHKKISTISGIITRYENKINHLKEVEGNLEEENVLDGLKPPREIKAKPTTITFSEKYKAYIDKKALETGYYANARTDIEDKNFKDMDSKAQELKEKNDANLKEKVQANKKKAESKKKNPTKSVKDKKIEQKSEPEKSAQVNEVEKEVEPEKSTQDNKVESELEQSSKNNTKSYSELTDEELIAKRKELFDKIVENDEYDFRVHKQNGMEGYEEDQIDKDLRAIRKELEVRESKRKEQKSKEVNEESIPNSKNNKSLNWHKSLTPEQINYAIEKGIYEPQGEEYEQFLMEMGINKLKAKKESIFKKAKNLLKNIEKRLDLFKEKLRIRKRLPEATSSKTQIEETDRKKFAKGIRVEPADTEKLYVPEHVKETIKEWEETKEPITTNPRGIQGEEGQR